MDLVNTVADNNIAYAFLMVLLSFGSTFLTDIIKRAAGADGRKALYLTVAVSAVMALIAVGLTGQLRANPESLISTTMLIFGLATLVYKSLKPEPVTPTTTVV